MPSVVAVYFFVKVYTPVGFGAVASRKYHMPEAPS